MMYAILRYRMDDGVSQNNEDGRWSEMPAMKVVTAVIGLLPLSTAVYMRQGAQGATILDAPSAHLPQQLSEILLADCASLNEAIEIAKAQSGANPMHSFEVRPLLAFDRPARADANDVQRLQNVPRGDPVTRPGG
jgi:hypothetical protein